MNLSSKDKLTIDPDDLVSALSTPLCILDSEHVIIRCNSAMATLFKKSEEQLKGNTFLTILSELGTVHPPPTRVIFYPTILHSKEIVGAGNRTFTVTIDPVVDNGTLLYSIQTTREQPESSAVLPDTIDGRSRIVIEKLYYGVIFDFMNLLAGNVGLAEFMLHKEVTNGQIESCAKSIIQSNATMVENIKNLRGHLHDLLNNSSQEKIDTGRQDG